MQTLSVPTDSIKLREMQISVTPLIAQISGQAIVGAIDSAIDAGFSGAPEALTPNGGGFTFHIALDQPEADIIGNVSRKTDRSSGARSGGPASERQIRSRWDSAGSLANGRQGGNGSPPDNCTAMGFSWARNLP